MEKYEIEIEEILQHTYEIEAESLVEAIEIAKEKYRDGEYYLDEDDWKKTNYREYKDEITKNKIAKNRDSR